MTPLLLIEDDDRVIDIIARGLSMEGYDVDICSDKQTAIEKTNSKNYPVLILDRMLNGIDGLEICMALRNQGYYGHIIILTAINSVDERIRGLQNGADDYMSKPFEFAELLARLEAVKRKEERKNNPEYKQRFITIGDLTLNLETHKATFNEATIDLTKREFELLRFLMENNGEIVSRPQILKSVWGYDFEPGTKLVEVYIRYLRKKLDNPDNPSIIESLRGIGYRLRL